VSHDAFGLHDGTLPPFVRQYEKLGDKLIAAARAYMDEVRSGQFPERTTGSE
jgi:3-methyl-2-oxobutanoate hydroxymethyltransferase